jgi:hypothetical protein
VKVYQKGCTGDEDQYSPFFIGRCKSTELAIVLIKGWILYLEE